jgi:uncharacterized protein YdhG (YjbR/CyaY superfamily)
MNERIRELVKEAAREMNETGTYSEPKFQEKFAELIIDECCSKLLDMDQKVNGNHNYYKHAAIEIKRSFK